MPFLNNSPVGSGDLTTGTITANGQAVAAFVGNYGSAALYVTGTFSSVNCIFEGSIDGTNWFVVNATRTSSNTVESTTTALSSAPTYGWELGLSGLNWLRVRATAFTSGTQTWVIQPAFDAVEPVPSLGTPSVAQSGAWTVTVTTPSGTAYSAATTASTNAASVKSSAGNLFEITVSNPTATAAYVKLYNKASAPTVGTDVPVVTIPAAAGTFQNVKFGANGKRFATGIAIATTAAAAATDTANAVAGVQIHGTYI